MSTAKREGSVGAKRVKEGSERRSKRRSEVAMALAKRVWPPAWRRRRTASRSLVGIPAGVVGKQRRIVRVKRIVVIRILWVAILLGIKL